jgi:hypothetical protein
LGRAKSSPAIIEGTGPGGWPYVVQRFNAKFECGLSGASLSEVTTEDLATRIVVNIMQKKSFKDKRDLAVLRIQEKKALKELEMSHPEGDVQLGKARANAVAKHSTRSVVVCYEISFRLYQIDWQEAGERLEKLGKKLREQERIAWDEWNKSQRGLRKSVKELEESLEAAKKQNLTTGNLKYDAIEADIKPLQAQLTNLRAQKEGIEADVKASKEQLFEKWKEVVTDLGGTPPDKKTLRGGKINGEVAKKPANTRIGNFTVAAVGAIGSLATGVKWWNTDAAMTARARPKGQDGDVQVDFKFEESAEGIGSFGSVKHHVGELSVTPGGEWTPGPGRISEQFKLFQTGS